MATEIKPDSSFRHPVNSEEEKKGKMKIHFSDLFPGHEGEPNPPTKAEAELCDG